MWLLASGDYIPNIAEIDNALAGDPDMNLLGTFTAAYYGMYFVRIYHTPNPLSY